MNGHSAIMMSASLTAAPDHIRRFICCRGYIRPALLFYACSLHNLLCSDSYSVMSSRRSERARKRPLSIDTHNAPPSLTSLAASLRKPTETELGETAADVLAIADGVNGSVDTSLHAPNRPVGRSKGASARSRAGTATRTRTAAASAASASSTGNQENGTQTIHLQQQDGQQEHAGHHQQTLNGNQGDLVHDHDAPDLQEEGEKEDDEDEEDPVWQEFSQEYYEGMSMHAVRVIMYRF